MKQLEVTLALIDKFTLPLKQATTGMKGLTKDIGGNTQQAGAGAAGIWAVTESVMALLGPANEMNKALSEVRSIGTSEAALNDLSKTALKFTSEFGGNAVEVVRSAFDIQSAIASLQGTELSDFTMTAGILAKATQADNATITSYIGTMYGIFQKEADAMGRVNWVEKIAGQTAAAGNMFSATGGDMSAAFAQLGASATAARIDVAEQMAILGQLKTTLPDGGTAGAKYKAFLSGVGNAQKTLGMSFTNSDGTMKSAVEILTLIGDKYGDLSKVADSDLIKKAFGSDEAVDMVKLMVPQVKLLKSNIEAIGKVKGMGDAGKMARIQINQVDRLTATFRNLSIVLGRSLLSILDPVFKGMADVSAQVIKWMSQFSRITKVIGWTILALLGFVAVAAIVTLSIAVAKIIFAGFLIVITALRFALFLFGEALYFATAPITLIIIAVALLAVGLWYLVTHWKEVLAWIQKTEAFIWLMGVINQVAEFFTTAWASIAAGWQAVLTFFTTNSPLEIFSAAISAIGALFTGLWETVKSSFSAAWDWIVEKLNNLPGIEIPVTTTPQIASTSGGALAPLAPVSTGRGGIGGQMSQKNSTATSSRSMTIGTVQYNVANPMSPQSLAENMELYGYGG